jgi:hypothetical protein
VGAQNTVNVPAASTGSYQVFFSPVLQASPVRVAAEATFQRTISLRTHAKIESETIARAASAKALGSGTGRTAVPVNEMLTVMIS